jgi:C-methyltransferase C-terminal domain
LDVMATYGAFAKSIQKTKRRLLAFLIEAQESGKQVVGYGAPAKGNTLLNYCGVKSDLLAYTVDVSPHKQEMLLPGTRIPVYAPAKILETQPDYVLILPWNIREEIMNNMAAIREWGGKFVVPIPTLTVLE